MTTDTIELDIRGRVCPSCLLLALREANGRHEALRAGRTRLVLLTDNRDAIGTIPDAMNNMGLAVQIDKQEGHYRVIIAAPAQAD